VIIIDAKGYGCRYETFVNQKPRSETSQDKKKRKHKKKTKQTLIHAVTHIRLIEANPGKLVIARPSTGTRSTPRRPSSGAKASGGSRFPLMRTFLFKRSHQPLAWASM
jgi:hypothetical protein